MTGNPQMALYALAAASVGAASFDWIPTRTLTRAEALERWPIPENTTRARALSQGFEPGVDPYNSADMARAVDFGIARAEFHAGEALASVANLDDATVRRAAKIDPSKFGTPDAVRQARYSAIALENDRIELLAEAINLCAVGDVDELSDDGLGWADWVRRAKAAIA